VKVKLTYSVMAVVSHLCFFSDQWRPSWMTHSNKQNSVKSIWMQFQ